MPDTPPTTPPRPVAAGRAPQPRTADIVVIGAGLAGLTVARAVLRAAPSTRLTVLESADRAGGQLRTTVADGYTFEHGATSLMASHPETRMLLGELGLAGRVEPASPLARTMWLWLDGRLHEIPRSVPAAARTRLLSRRGKARVLAEPLLGRGRPRPDETLHEFVERRFGAEPARTLLAAMVQGITAGDPRATSLRALSPGLWQLDQAAGRGSLLLRVLRLRAQNGAAQNASPTGPATLRGGGLSVLADMLAASLGAAVEYGRTARTISTGGLRRYSVELGTGPAIEADKVVVAVPAHRASGLLAEIAPAAAAALERIEFTDLRVIGLGYPRSAFASVPSGFGFLAPPDQGLDIIGATISSNAFEEQAPPGRVLLRAFAGGVFAPDIANLDPEEALRVVNRDLHRVLGVRGEPDFVRDVVWRRAIPQYSRGHLGTLERLENALRHLPGLHLAGNSYRGPGLGDTIRESQRLGAVLAGEQSMVPAVRTSAAPRPQRSTKAR